MDRDQADAAQQAARRSPCKIHAVVDTNGLPVHLALTPGEAHDNRLCLVLLSALLPQTMLLADRGYDADWIRELVCQQGAWANIPPKRNRKDPICFSAYLYRARNLIERFFNKIKQCRRVATRYDKLAATYLAFIKLASIRIWLRANESAPLGCLDSGAKFVVGLLGGYSGLTEAPKRPPPPEEIAFVFYVFDRGIKRDLTGFGFGECCDNDWIARNFRVVGDERVIGFIAGLYGS
jgi:transposase